MNKLKSIVKKLISHSMRRNGLNLKKTGLSLMRWENCKCQPLFYIVR